MATETEILEVSVVDDASANASRIADVLERLEKMLDAVSAAQMNVSASLDAMGGTFTRGARAVDIETAALQTYEKQLQQTMELEARFQATSYQGGAKRFESNAQHEAAEHAEWLRHQARFRALDEQVQRKQAFDKLTSQVMFDRDQNLAYKTDEAFNQSRGRVTATAYAEDMKRTSKAAWDQLTSQVMFDRDRNLAYKMDEVFNQRRTAGYESSAASHWAGEVSRMEREGGVLSHLQPAGPRHFESNADYEARLASAGGGGGGFLSAIKGSGIWQAAAFLYTIERVGRGVERLAEVVEHAAEVRETQNETLRMLGIGEAGLGSHREAVEERAKRLNEPVSKFFEVFDKTEVIKAKTGEDPEGIFKARMDLAAGALVLAGGREKQAEVILAEFGRASQGLLGEGGRPPGFKNLMGIPGGIESLLERTTNPLTGSAYTVKEASDIVAPSAAKFQESLVLIEYAIAHAGDSRLPDALNKSLTSVEDAFTKLVGDNGFPWLTVALTDLASVMENSEGFANILRMLDFSLGVILETLDSFFAALNTWADDIRRTELLLHLGPPETEAEKQRYGTSRLGFEIGTGLSLGELLIPGFRHFIPEMAQTIAFMGYAKSHGGIIATLKDAGERFLGLNRRGSQPHSTSSSNDRVQLNVHIEHHINQQPGQSPTELAAHLSHISVMDLSSAHEHLLGLRAGLG